jgi:hypothetical protein
MNFGSLSSRFFLFLYVCMYVYIYIYMCVCVCMCVCLICWFKRWYVDAFIHLKHSGLKPFTLIDIYSWALVFFLHVQDFLRMNTWNFETCRRQYR